jgi:hypothetical protein
MKSWKWNEDHYSWIEGSKKKNPMLNVKKKSDIEEWVNVINSKEEIEISFINNVIDNWITIIINHWKITDCTDEECEKSA